MTNTKIPLALIASRVLDRPLMITRAKLDQIVDVVGGRIGLDTSDVLITTTMQYEPSQKSNRPYYTLDGSTAIISIDGTLVHKTSGFSGWSGMLSYSRIRDSFDDAMSNPNVESVLFDISSSGGEVAGVFDLADHIYSSRGTKPIYAISNESAYSAAYAIASAADHIYLSRTAGVGSIGVIMLHVDRSEADQKAGLKYTQIYAGDHKIDGSPHTPLSKEAKSTAQSIVDDVYSLFISTVARNNGISESGIRDTQAAIYRGQSAIDIGLADAVLSYQEVINKIKNSTTKGGIYTMPKRQASSLEDPKLPKLETPAKEPEVTVSSTETVIHNVPITPGPVTATTQNDVDDAIKAERERCITILESCSLAKVPSSALDLICDGSSVETAHKMIMTILAERSASTPIISAVNPARSGATNPLLANAKKRAESAKS